MTFDNAENVSNDLSDLERLRSEDSPAPKTPTTPMLSGTRTNPRVIQWVLPKLVYTIADLDWDATDKPCRPSLLYSPPEATLQVLSYPRPVRRKGLPCLAVIFLAADQKTRLLVARRLVSLVSDFGSAFETIRLHEEVNKGTTGAIVLTVDWSQRTRVQMLLVASLEHDQILQRMVLRASVSYRRQDFDRRQIAKFVDRGGLLRHFVGPRNCRYRFSDFQLDERVGLGLGLRVKLTFEDSEIEDFATRRFDEFSDSFSLRTDTRVIELAKSKQPSRDFVNTDLLWGDQAMTLTAATNSHTTRRQVGYFLDMVCGLDGIRFPLPEPVLETGFFDRQKAA